MNEAPDPASTSRGTPEKTTTYPLVTIYNKYIYDWVGRKLKTWEQLTNGNSTADTMRLVTKANYNEIGQTYSKQLHSTDSVNFIQTVAYTYNERGWLFQSSAPLFAMTLYYNTNANKAYNGNIMYQYWGTPGNLNNHYTYKYDELNRLMSGVTTADNYQESGIAYDTQGNLTSLNRYQAGTQIDQLMYYYNSKNSLDSVKDLNGSNLGLVAGKTSYTYDGNGNMLSAANTVNTGQNKSFTYNILDLPNVVTVPNGTDTYTYDASGEKLRKVSVIGGVTTNTDYIGGIQYNGSGATDTLSFIQTEEGKAVHNGTTYDYQYYLADNLGNTRVTFNTKKGAAYVVQQDDYYPFGLEIIRTPPHDAKNEYLYNKKELQEDFNEYDYGARFYDPVIARWNTIDPMAEASRRWSPYNYVEDSPIMMIDPDGMDETLIAGKRHEKSNGGTADDLLDMSNIAEEISSRPDIDHNKSSAQPQFANVESPLQREIEKTNGDGVSTGTGDDEPNNYWRIPHAIAGEFGKPKPKHKKNTKSKAGNESAAQPSTAPPGTINSKYGVGVSLNAGIGIGKEGIELSAGTFRAGQGFGQSFLTIGFPKNWYFYDSSASIQAMFGKSNTNYFDLAGEGETYAGGIGPVVGGVSRGLDKNTVVNTVYSGGYAVGAKYTGGGVKTYTFTWTSLFLLLDPINGK